MKTIKLVSKEVQSGENKISIDSKSMITSALEGYAENRKGLSRIGKSLKILNKLEVATEELSLEDDEFNIVYESIDKIEWLPTVFKFKEFFEILEEAKASK